MKIIFLRSQIIPYLDTYIVVEYVTIAEEIQAQFQPSDNFKIAELALKLILTFIQVIYVKHVGFTYVDFFFGNKD